MALGVVDLGGGAWGIEETDTPDAYIIDLGGGAYAIDPDATSGATITTESGAYFFEFVASSPTSGRGKRRYWIDIQRDQSGRVIGWVTNSPVI